MPGKSHGMTLRGLVIAGFLSAGGAADAAPDARAVADAVVAAATAAGGRTASYENAVAEGDDIVITNLKISRSANTTALLPRVVIASPSPRDKGGFTAARMTFDGGKTVSHEQTLTWRTGLMTDVIVPSVDEVKARADVRPFASLTIGAIQILEKDAPKPATIDEVSVTCAEVAEGGPRDCVTAARGMVVTTDMLAGMPRQKSMVDSLGYAELRIDLAMDAGYDQSNGSLDLRNINIDIADFGQLTISGKLSDMPIEKAEGQSVRSGITRNTRLDRLAVRFENKGFVERALAAQARMTNMTAAEVVDQANGTVLAGLIVIGNMDFAARVSEAVSSFLADPKSLTIEVAPGTPITISSIASQVFSDPGALVDLLGVGVKANQ